MASIYYDQTKVKSDLRITDTGNDTQLDHWSDEAQSEIDDLLYDKATKARRITSLPILPFSTGNVPESVQGASDHLVKARYFEFTKNLELAQYHKKEADTKIQRYVERLTIDKQFYGRVTH